jgi:hypothetical protein
LFFECVAFLTTAFSFAEFVRQLAGGQELSVFQRQLYESRLFHDVFGEASRAFHELGQRVSEVDIPGLELVQVREVKLLLHEFLPKCVGESHTLFSFDRA